MSNVQRLKDLANRLVVSAARCQRDADRQSWDDGRFDRGMAAGLMSAANQVAWVYRDAVESSR